MNLLWFMSCQSFVAECLFFLNEFSQSDLSFEEHVKIPRTQPTKPRVDRWLKHRNEKIPPEV